MRQSAGLDILPSPVTTVDQIARTLRCFVLANTYRDSVELMRVAAELEARPGVRRAALVMATAANREVLRGAELLADEALGAGPNDLVVAISGDTVAVEQAQTHAQLLLSGRGPVHAASGTPG